MLHLVVQIDEHLVVDGGLEAVLLVGQVRVGLLELLLLLLEGSLGLVKLKVEVPQGNFDLSRLAIYHGTGGVALLRGVEVQVGLLLDDERVGRAQDGKTVTRAKRR